jgi:hypothetical protein
VPLLLAVLGEAAGVREDDRADWALDQAMLISVEPSLVGCADGLPAVAAEVLVE